MFSLQLAAAAQGQLAALAGLLKLPAAAELPAAIAIVAVKALGAVAAQRPALLGRTLPTLLALASGHLSSHLINLFSTFDA